MKRLTILYDERCALCRRARDWLARQRAFVRLELVPAGGAEARRRYPSLSSEEMLEQLTVVADEHAVYRGHKAWLLCLWALEDYRAWSLRLAGGGTGHLARRAIDALSIHRYRLSDVLTGRTSPTDYLLGASSETRRP